MAGTITAETVDVAELMAKELAKDATKIDRPSRAPVSSTAEAMTDATARLPRRIPGGFRAVGDELERRSREWRNTFRLLDMQRPQLEAAETERERLHAALNRIVPEAQETARSLKALLETTKSGDISGDIASQFSKNQSALDELEGVAEALTANLLWVRSAWEQYARTIIRGQKLREEMKQLAGDVSHA